MTSTVAQSKLAPSLARFSSYQLWVSERSAAACQALLGALSIYSVLILVLIGGLRVSYPFELEWIEGAIIDSCRWVIAGNPLYTTPRLDFVALPYNPLYIYLSAALMQVLGVGFFAPRLLSLLASISCLVIIYLLVKRDSHSRIGALTAVGLFAAAFRATGAWTDLARADTLFLLFTLLAGYAARRLEARPAMLLSSILLLLAYATKQPALLLFPLFALYYVAVYRYQALVFLLVSAGLVVGLHLYSDAVSGGWFSFYTRDIALGFIAHDQSQSLLMLADLRIFVGAIILSLMALLQLRRAQRSGAFFHLLFASGFVAISYIGRVNPGGYDNVLMPLAAAVAILSGLAIAQIVQAGSRDLVTLSTIIATAQFALLLYNPATQVPSPTDRLAGQKMLDTIRSFQGDVYVPMHTYYAAEAGKSTAAHWGAIADITGGFIYTSSFDAWRGSRTEQKRRIILDELRGAIEQERFDAIIVDELAGTGMPFPQGFVDMITPHYVLRGNLFDRSERLAFWPRTGFATRPQYVYVARRLEQPQR